MAKRTFTVTVKLTENENKTYKIEALTIEHTAEGVGFYSDTASMIAFVPLSNLISVVDDSVLDKDKS